MKKVKVRFLDSIAVLGDPKPPLVLDQQYAARIEQMNQGRNTPLSKGCVDALIAQWRQADRYGEKPQGFIKDMAWKPGEEAMIDVALAANWEEAQICVIVREAKAA